MQSGTRHRANASSAKTGAERRLQPDGRSLVYAAERDNSWNVHTTTIGREEEPYFHASTLLEEKPVVATTTEEFQPEFSPDGKEVAYLEDRVVLKVANLASVRTRTIVTADHNYSLRVRELPLRCPVQEALDPVFLEPAQE